MSEYLRNGVIPILRLNIESTMNIYHENTLIIDKMLMGVDINTNSIILADKANPTKLKSYSAEKTRLLKEIYFEKFFMRLTAPAETAILVATRTAISIPGIYTGQTYDYEDQTGVGSNVPPTFGRTDLPDTTQWHPVGCHCNPKKISTFTNTCGGFGGWHMGPPAYP